MSQYAPLISHNQRILDQLALENLDGLRIKKELAVQEKIRHNRSLVLDYLHKKLPYVKNIDSSTIDKMAEDEFNRVLRRVKISHLSIFGLKIILFLIIFFCTVLGSLKIIQMLLLFPAFLTYLLTEHPNIFGSVVLTSVLGFWPIVLFSTALYRTYRNIRDGN